MRIEPPLVATKEMCDVMVRSIDDVLNVIDKYGSMGLLYHLTTNRSMEAFIPPQLQVEHKSFVFNKADIVFLFNLQNATDYKEVDGTLELFTDKQMKDVAER